MRLLQDAAGTSPASLTALQRDGVQQAEVYGTGTVQRRIVEALRSALSWERFDVYVPPHKQSLVFGSHIPDAIAVCCPHLASQIKTVVSMTGNSDIST